jgi:hypothetical protein
VKRGRSTGAPTKEEAARIVACKEGRCVACWIREREGKLACDGEGCDFHHMKSGNVRRGHMFGIGLCTYHHRGYPVDWFTVTESREAYGPSLMHGSRLFHDTYGSDDELLAIQNRILAGD